MRIPAILAIALMAAPAFAQQSIQMPADMSGYFNRARLCAKYSGEKSDTYKALLCEQLPADKAALQKKYSNNQDLMTVLSWAG